MEEKYERVYDKKLVMSIFATGLLTFTGIIVETAMNVTFPTLMEQFNISTSTVQWCTTGYLLALSIVITISAFLKKRFKTKQLFVTALLLFLAGTVLCALAPAFSLLLCGRMIQGIATGIALPLMMNIILEQATLEKTGMLMGVAMLITAVAPAIGPALGGVLVDTLGWRSIFWVLVPLLLISFVLGIISIRQGWKTEKISLNFTEWIMLAISFICLILATSYIPELGIWSPIIWLLFLGCIVFLLLFVRHSKKCTTPLIDVEIFSSKIYIFTVIAIFTQQIVCLGIGYVVPNLPQLSWGVSSSVAGMIMVPGCLVAAIFSPVAGKWLDKVGPIKPITLGIISAVTGTFLIAFVAPRTGWVFSFMFFYIIFAIGLAFLTGNIITNGLRHVKDKYVADGNAINNTVQQLAGGVGTAIATTIVAIAQSDTTRSIATTTYTGAIRALMALFIFQIVALICVVIALRLTAKKKK